MGEPPNREAGRRETFEQFVAARSTLSQRLLQQLRLMPLARDIADITASSSTTLTTAAICTSPAVKSPASSGSARTGVLAALAAVQGAGTRRRRRPEFAGVFAAAVKRPGRCAALGLGDCVPAPGLGGQGQNPALAEVLGADIADVQRAVDYMKGLEPKPGLSLDQEVPPAYIFPDVTVLAAGGSGLSRSTTARAPRLRLNPLYYRLLRSADGRGSQKVSPGQVQFGPVVAEVPGTAPNHFVPDYRVYPGLSARFLCKGSECLRPLRLKDVADALDIHESTVSRALSGKMHPDAPGHLLSSSMLSFPPTWRLQTAAVLPAPG